MNRFFRQGKLFRSHNSREVNVVQFYAKILALPFEEKQQQRENKAFGKY